MEKHKQLIKAIREFQGDPDKATASELIAWIDSVCPWAGELLHAEESEMVMYEIWVGIDSAKLVELKEFPSYSDAYDYAFEEGQKLYELDDTCPDIEVFRQEGYSEDAAEEHFSTSQLQRIVASVKEADNELYEESEGKVGKYYELVAEGLEPTWPQGPQ